VNNLASVTSGKERPAELRLLGALEVRSPGGAPVPLGGRLAKALFALLLVVSPEPMSADRLVEELWADDPPVGGHRTLQVYVSRLRKQVSEGLGQAVLISSSGAGYVLERDGASVDVLELERCLGDAEVALAESPRIAASRFREALAMWRGTALAEFGFVPALAREAERLDDLRATASEGLAQALLACGNPAEAVRAVRPLVGAYPRRERSRLLLMRALYGADRHDEALNEYQNAVAALDEIGLEPGRALRDLQGAILRHEPWLTESILQRSGRPPELKIVDDARGRDGQAQSEVSGNVRLPSHPLVGRRRELALVSDLLTDRKTDLVTLHGSGGVGKTRVAIEIATLLAHRYAHGAWFVSLDALSDPDLVASEIARIIGISLTPGESAQSSLSAWLSTRELLLVLDNFEHLISAGALVTDLLGQNPGLQVLVTSRESLDRVGETLVEVAPLSRDEAAELFIDRARALRPNLETGPEASAAVASICAQLDGLALALELTAARAALFSLPALARRLGDRLDVAEVVREVPERQRTLRRAIDWSYALLSPEERRAFRALAAFPGGARIEALAEVLQEAASDIVDILTGLVAKSLVGRSEDHDGEPRVGMLSTIREYADGLLGQDDERHTILARHAGHYAELAHQAATRFYEADQAEWLDRVGDDHENLRAVLSYLNTNQRADALRLAVALAPFWDGRGYYGESRTWLSRLLNALPESDLDVARARFWLSRLAFQWRSGEDAQTMLDAPSPPWRPAATSATESSRGCAAR
jgi:predicted ATPase/DNA-binding SARP family transcriptional activator